MPNRVYKAHILVIALTVPFTWNWAQAALVTYVEYYPCSGGSDCQQSQTPLSAFTTDNETVSVGDSNGNATAQSNHGTLNGSASGSWLGENIPTLTSYGFANPYFEDTITLSGGIGSVEVTVTLKLEGAVSTAVANTDGAGIIEPIVSLNVNDLFQYAQLFLYQSAGYGEIELMDNTSATWSSANGIYTQGNTEGIFPLATKGNLTLKVNLPYDTPVLLQVDLGIDGYHSVASNTKATLALAVPEGTTVVSESGVNYVVTPTEARVTTLPQAAFWILFAALAWISVIKPKFKKYQ